MAGAGQPRGLETQAALLLQTLRTALCRCSELALGALSSQYFNELRYGRIHSFSRQNCFTVLHMGREASRAPPPLPPPPRSCFPGQNRRRESLAYSDSKRPLLPAPTAFGQSADLSLLVQSRPVWFPSPSIAFKSRSRVWAAGEATCQLLDGFF